MQGEDTLAGWRGGGGSIVRKTPDTALNSIYVSTLWSRPSDSSDMCVWQGGAKMESIWGGGVGEGAELNGRLKGFNERNVKREKRMAKGRWNINTSVLYRFQSIEIDTCS